MSTLPTLVFIHGSWHKPTCYDKITKPLHEKHQFDYIAVTLPSTTGDPEATFKDDIDVVRDAISGETTHGRDVVIIAHSYGGMVGNSAIKGFTRLQNTITSKPAPMTSEHPVAPTTGHVIGLILIASGFTMTGLAFMDPFFGQPPPAWRVNNETGLAELVGSPRELFYHDLPLNEADFWVSQLTSQSLKALFEGGEHAYAGWMDVPVWYIGTVEDRGLPILVQRIQVGVARELNSRIEHRELQTSHSPFLSQPDETVEIILDAVGSFTGQPIGTQSTHDEKSSRIVVPMARRWQLVTWYRFGIPLLFGHIIGKGILIFAWTKRVWNFWFR